VPGKRENNEGGITAQQANRQLVIDTH